MPRAARIAPKGSLSHVLTRGNNRQDLFKDEGDYLKYIVILQKYKERGRFKLHHYVFMRNHVPLVSKGSAREFRIFSGFWEIILKVEGLIF